jgi:hypothetical protein
LRTVQLRIGRLLGSEGTPNRPGLLLALCVFGTLAVSACQDMQSNPLALAVASETHGAVLFAEDLPSVPHLLQHEGLVAQGSPEAEAWWESWRLGGEEGAQLRSLVYPSTVRLLYPAMGEGGVREFLRGNDERLHAAQATRSVLGSEAVQSALQRAVAIHGDAWAAFSRGEGEEALILALASVDALWEVTPQQVAVDLVERAEEALGRNDGSVPYSNQELTRIRRLLNGAREALGEGDYPLAIRRAYYACQLLGADPP